MSQNIPRVFGRIVAGLRQELGVSQVSFAAELGWDVGRLARIETGRSDASVSHVFVLGEAFCERGFIQGSGELMRLVSLVVAELERRPAARLERVVSVVLDRWFHPETLEAS